MNPRRDVYGLLWVAIFSALWLVLLIGLNIAVGVLLVGSLLLTSGGDALSGVEPLLAGGVEDALPDWFFAALLSVQMPAMLGLTLLVAWMYRTWQGSRGERVVPWAGLFAARSAPLGAFAVAAVVGVTVGWLPGWFAGWLRELLPWLDLGALELIEDALTGGTPLLRLVAGFWIVAGAGLFEELVFRGLLWRLLLRSASPVAVWLATSLLFAVYHMDPVQSLALIPTALALGWLRLRTGSLWPCVTVHMLNNGLGVLAVWIGLSEGPPLWGCALAFTVAVGALALTPRVQPS